MTAQPTPIAGWASDLDLFPAEIAPALDGMVARLLVTIGPMRSRALGNTGEPDGFDGLTTRGLYDRLLLSEWLMAEEMPDEFLRRASAGEHLFLRPVRREPTGRRACIALFDPGPSQLGAPRIVQIALLIALARRAAAAGASFAWSLQDDPARRLFEQIDAQTIRALLSARRSTPVGGETLAQWRARTAPTLGVDGELWMVGGPESRSGSTNAIVLSDTLETEARVRVDVHSRTGTRQTVLTMPETDLAVRLIRDPFRDAVPSRARDDIQPASNPVFSWNGMKLFVRGTNGRLFVVPVPNSPRMPVGKIKTLRPWGAVVAAGVVGSRYKLLLQAPTGHTYVQSHPVGDTITVATPEDEPFYEHDAPIGELLPRPHGLGGHRERYLFVGNDRTLYQLQSGAPPSILARDVLALANTWDGFCLIASATENFFGEPTIDRWSMVDVNDRQRTRTAIECGFKPKAAVLASGPRHTHAFALMPRQGEWQFIASSNAGNARADFFFGGRVIGLTGDRPDEATFVVLEQDDRTISVVGRHRHEILVRTESPILHATIAKRTGVLAWLAEEGELGFASAPRREILQRRALGIRR